MADRVLVLREGRLVAEIARADADEDSIMRAATGQLAVTPHDRRSTSAGRARSTAVQPRPSALLRARELGIVLAIVIVFGADHVEEPALRRRARASSSCSPGPSLIALLGGRRDDGHRHPQRRPVGRARCSACRPTSSATSSCTTRTRRSCSAFVARHRHRRGRRRDQRLRSPRCSGCPSLVVTLARSTSSAASTPSSSTASRSTPTSIPRGFQTHRLRDRPGIDRLPWLAVLVLVVVAHRRLRACVLPLGPRPLRDRLQPEAAALAGVPGRPPGVHRVRHQRRAGRPRRRAVPRRVRHRRRHRRHRLRAARHRRRRRRRRRDLRRQRHGVRRRARRPAAQHDQPGAGRRSGVGVLEPGDRRRPAAARHRLRPLARPAGRPRLRTGRGAPQHGCRRCTTARRRTAAVAQPACAGRPALVLVLDRRPDLRRSRRRRTSSPRPTSSSSA